MNILSNIEKFTVSQLNYSIKNLIENKFQIVSVIGEVSQVKKHSSGHIYFSLKDEESVISVICWRSVVPRLKINIEDGIHAVKMLLPRCYIDVDNCSKLINALRHYHRKYKEKDNIYSAKPNHDWSSHANDALRYLATGLQREKINNNQNFQRDYNYGFTI